LIISGPRRLRANSQRFSHEAVVFTADVAVDVPNEIAQDFSDILAHSQGTFCWVVHFRNCCNTSNAVGLSRVPQKTTNTTLRIICYHLLALCCTSPKKKKKTSRLARLVFVRARTAVKILLGYMRTGKIKSNALKPHLQTSATMSRCFELKKTAVALPLCSESTQQSIAGWCIFETKVLLKFWQSDGVSYTKNTRVEVLPIVDLLRKKRRKDMFFVGGATEVGGFIRASFVEVTTKLENTIYLVDTGPTDPKNTLKKKKSTITFG